MTAGQSFAGRFVFLQRFTLAKTWINVGRLQLGQQSGRIMGMKYVRSVIPRGRWSIRIYMPASEMPRRLHRRVERHAARRQALTHCESADYLSALSYLF